MNLRKVLSPRVMFHGLDAAPKETVITRMVHLLAGAHGVSDVEPLVAAVLDRERKDSTGLEYGIAVPHGKTDAVDRLLAGIALVNGSVDFASRDGKPARILVMTVSPAARSGPHLQFIGEVVRLLRDATFRDALLAASDSRQMYEAITR